MGGSVASKCHPSLRAQLASLNLKGAKWEVASSGFGKGLWEVGKAALRPISESLSPLG